MNIIPDHNLDAEQSLLASLIINNSLFRFCGGISPDDLYLKKHQIIFQTMLAIKKAGDVVDLVTVGEHLKNSGLLKQAGGAAYLVKITETAALFNMAEYVRIIKENSLSRAVKIKCSEILSDTNIHGTDLLEKAQSEILNIKSTAREDKIRPLRDIVINHLERIESANSKEDYGMVYRTGFPNIDRCLKIRDGKLIIIAGRPKMGKTALAVSIAHNMDKAHITVGFLSIEMPESEIMDRLISIESNVDSSKFGRFGAMSVDDVKRINNAARALYDKSHILIDDTGSLDISDVERKCRLLKSKGAEVIFIDQLSQIGNKAIRAGEHTILFSENCNRIARLKKELGLPIFLLHQLNRDMKNRSNKEPEISDLKQSGRIEEDADAVIFVHRPEVYATNDKDRSFLDGVSFLLLSLNRSGPTFRDTKVFFNKPTTYFYQENDYDKKTT